MKKYYTKSLWGLLTCVLLSTQLPAQKTIFKTLVPHHLQVQHGGGIGYLAVGFGYSSRNKNMELDFLYGYLPAKVGGIDIHSATAKFNFIPFSPIESKVFVARPLVVGALVNYSFGKQYFSFNPRNYPYDYYNFPTAFNSAIYLGGRAGIKFPGAGRVKNLSFYYEVIIFDRELISYVGNTQALDFDDILTLGIGLKLSFK